MSAETAGEQYTPDDVINLISELIVTDEFKENYPYKLYDMTCGGGNMLYGIDDKIKRKNVNIKTETYGQELRGSLYSLYNICLPSLILQVKHLLCLMDHHYSQVMQAQVNPIFVHGVWIMIG